MGGGAHAKEKLKSIVSDMAEQMATEAPAEVDKRPDFSGTWKCVEVEGDWDRYLELLDIPETQRKLAFGCRYGKGHAIQIIKQEGGAKEHLEITNVQFIAGCASWPGDHPLKGNDAPKTLQPRRLEAEVYTVSSVDRSVAAADAEADGEMRIGWEGEAIVSRYAAGSRRLPCVIKRKLSQNGRVMTMTVLIENFFASRTYKPCYDSGQLVDFYDDD